MTVSGVIESIHIIFIYSDLEQKNEKLLALKSLGIHQS